MADDNSVRGPAKGAARGMLAFTGALLTLGVLLLVWWMSTRH